MEPPIVVNASTTFVQVDTLVIPNTKVFLSTTSYIGQFVTLYDNTNSDEITSYPILVSTNQSFLFDGILKFSTTINQPQGSITALSDIPNQWRVVNSYPFRDEFFSAGLITLKTSSFFSQIQSSLIETASSVVTKNLAIFNNFTIDSNVAIQTNISALNEAVFTSSLRVSGSTFFSSSLRVDGFVDLQSTLSVFGNATINSHFYTTENVNVSSFMGVASNVVVSNVSIGQGLTVGDLSILSTSLDALHVGGTLTTEGFVRLDDNLTVDMSFFASSIRVHSLLEANQVSVEGNFKSSDSIHPALLKGVLEVGETIHIGENLDVSGNLTVGQIIQIENEVILGEQIKTTESAILQNVYTQTLSTSTLLADIADISGIFLENGIGVSDIFLKNATILNGSISSLNDTFSETIRTNANFTSASTITLGHLVTPSANANLQGELKVGGNLVGNGTDEIAIISSVSLGGATVIQGNAVFQSSLSTVGNITIEGNVFLNTFNFPQNPVLSNLEANEIHSGGFGRFLFTTAKSIFASSIQIGTNQSSEYQFEVSGNLIASNSQYITQSLSSFSLTQIFASLPSIWVGVGQDAVSPNKNILISQDGITWTNNTNPPSGVNFTSVANNAIDKFVALDTNGNLWYSFNGIDWNLGNKPPGIFHVSSGSATQQIAFAKGRWIALIDSSFDPTTNEKGIFLSDDGITWFLGSIFPNATPGNSIIQYGKNNWVLTLIISSIREFYYSVDGGFNWNLSFTLASGGVGSIDYNPINEIFLAGSFASQILQSTDDGQTWMFASPPPFPFPLLSFDGKGRWVGVGIFSDNIYYSDDDGQNWIFATTLGLPVGPVIKQVSYGGNKWVLCIDDAFGLPTFVYSFDGETWQSSVAFNPFVINSISFNNAPLRTFNPAELNVSTDELPEGLKVGGNAVFHDEVSSDKTVSTGVGNVNFARGNLVGDGALLTNVNLPSVFSGETLVLSSFSTVYHSTNFFHISSLFIEEELQVLSTLQVADIYIQGNVSGNPTYIEKGHEILAYPNELVLNHSLHIGIFNPLQSSFQSIVGIRTAPISPPETAGGQLVPSPFRGLNVNGVLACDGIDAFFLDNGLLDPLIPFSNVIADTLALSTFGVDGDLYISSGRINFSTLIFLRPDNNQTPLSTNTIQGFSNYLALNSSLFVYSELSSVGFNKQNPVYNLDINGNFLTSTFLTSSCVVESQIKMESASCNVWVGVTETSPLIYYSEDGTTWNSNQIFGISESDITNVAYNGKVWIAAGSLPFDTNASLLSSTDGINWESIQNTQFGCNAITTPPSTKSLSFVAFGIAWNGSQWISVGSADPSTDSGIKISSDGKNWLASISGGFLGSATAGFSVAWNGEYWLACGASPAPESNIQKSFDGFHWTPSDTTNIPLNPTRSIAWNGKIWVSVGQSNSIKVSSDGSNWSNSSNGLSFGENGSKVSWNGSYFLAVGQNTISKSSDGFFWNTVFSFPGGFQDGWTGLTWNGSFWLVPGMFDSRGIIAKSFDGDIWSIPEDNNLNQTSTVIHSFGYSSNVNPLAQISTLTLWENPYDTIFRSTSRIVFTHSTIIFNDTISLDNESFSLPPLSQTSGLLASFQVSPGIFFGEGITSTTSLHLAAHTLSVQYI
jgi:hypothetical protein